MLEFDNLNAGDAAQWWDGGRGVRRASGGDAAGDDGYDYDYDNVSDDFNRNDNDDVAGQAGGAVHGDGGRVRHRPTAATAQRDGLCHCNCYTTVCAGAFSSNLSIIIYLILSMYYYLFIIYIYGCNLCLQEPAVSNGHESSMIRIVGIQDRRPGGSVVKVLNPSTFHHFTWGGLLLRF